MIPRTLRSPHARLAVVVFLMAAGVAQSSGQSAAPARTAAAKTQKIDGEYTAGITRYTN